jgi:flagellar biosynthesis protein FlhB
VEFGDIVLASATFFVVTVLFYLLPPFGIIFQYTSVSFVLSVLAAGLIVGFMYAHKLTVEKIKSIFKILAVSAVLLAFFTASMTFTDWTTYQAAGGSHPEAVTTAEEFLLQVPYWTVSQIVIEWLVGGPFAFIGLYAGSLTRKK